MKTASSKTPRGKMKLVGANERGDVVMQDRRGRLHPFERVREGEPLSEERQKIPVGTFVDAGNGEVRFKKSRELGHKGPARVSSPEFRDNWTRIFGVKTSGGAPN